MDRLEAQTPTYHSLQRLNEFELVISHRECLAIENYTGCALIKQEVNRRVETGTLDLGCAIDGFRNMTTGEVNYSNPSGDIYRHLPTVYPHLFTRNKADEHRLSIPANRVNLKKLLKSNRPTPLF